MSVPTISQAEKDPFKIAASLRQAVEKINGTTGLSNNSVTDAYLRDSAALSVIGRSANSSGDPADIAAANDGEVLRRSGASLGFGTVVTAGIAADAVTNATLANMTATTIKARGTASTGDPEDIAIGNGLALDATSLRTAQQMSVTVDASGLKLSGDAASPGNSQYYGTNSGGTKGFYSLPSSITLVTAAGHGGGTTISITNIPACKLLFVVFNSISSNSGGTAALQIALSSNNGTSYGTAVDCSAALSGASAFHGPVHVYQMGETSGWITHGLVGGSNTTGAPSSTSAAVVNAVRFSWAGGASFDGGSYYVYSV